MAIKPLKSIKFPGLPDTYTVPQVDATPTANSTNAVQSGGVKSALDTLQAQIPQIDPTLSQSGQAADSKVVGDKISEVKEDLNAKFVNGKNLINPSDVSTGTLISANDGRTEPNASYNSCGYIPIASGQSVTISPNCRKFIAFDSSKTAIASTYINKGVSTTYTFTASVDGYVRISYLAANATEQIEYGTEATAYEPYSVSIANGIELSNEQKTYIENSIAGATGPIETDISNIKESFEEEKSDKVVSITVTKTDDNTGYINQNGAIDPSATGYFYTDYIPVTDGDLITSQTVGGTATPLRYIASYDSNKAIDKTKGWNNSGQSFDAFVVPSGIAYIRATFYVSRQSTQILIVTTPDGISTYYAITEYVPILKGKKWVACGDSFTQGDFSGLSATEFKYQDGKYVGQNKVYPFVIGLRTGAEIVNEAISGSTMAYVDGTHNEFSTLNGRYTQIPSDADYITMYFGINDSHHQVPIGTINDTGNTTFYGAWNTVMQYLIANYPDAKIGIIISNGCDTIDYPNAEIAIAKKYGVAYLDMNSDYKVPILFRVNGKPETDASIIQANYEHYRVSSTNGHPNVAMHEYESTIIQHWLESI